MYHHVILKLGREIIKKACQSLKLFRRGRKEHIPCTAFKPCFTYPKRKRYKVDYPVIDFPVSAFQFGNVAITDENGPGKLGLRHVKGGSELPYPLIYRHR